MGLGVSYYRFLPKRKCEKKKKETTKKGIRTGLRKRKVPDDGVGRKKLKYRTKYYEKSFI